MKTYLSYILLALLFSSCAFEEPYFTTISVYNCNRIALGDKNAFIEDIPFEIYLKTKDLDSVQKSKFFVKLKISKDAKVEYLKKVQLELKKANVLKVREYKIENLNCRF